MTNKKRIFLPHGQIKRLATLTGVSDAACTKFLKGWFDELNPRVAESAEKVRKTALEQCGGIYASE